MAEPTPTEDEIASVLRRYVHDGRLTAMPRAGRRRLIVLEQIVQQFEPGRRYSEEKVNSVLRAVWPDTPRCVDTSSTPACWPAHRGSTGASAAGSTSSSVGGERA